MITNEHVVAMMKAAIRETQDMPMFVRAISLFIVKVFPIMLLYVYFETVLLFCHTGAQNDTFKAQRGC